MKKFQLFKCLSGPVSNQKNCRLDVISQCLFVLMLFLLSISVLNKSTL